MSKIEQANNTSQHEVNRLNEEIRNLKDSFRTLENKVKTKNTTSRKLPNGLSVSEINIRGGSRVRQTTA